MYEQYSNRNGPVIDVQIMRRRVVIPSNNILMFLELFIKKDQKTDSMTSTGRYTRFDIFVYFWISIRMWGKKKEMPKIEEHARNIPGVALTKS